MDFSAYRGVIGIFVLLAIAYGLSKSKKDINFRTVGFAFLLQLLLGAFVLYVPFGKDVLTTITSSVQSVIDSAKVGISFLFGGLGTDAMYENGVGFVFAIRVLPNIIFFSSLIAVLYYLGIMQWVIKIIGGSLQKLLKTSKPESLSATANIFVGQTEAPLVVRPYIAKMTQSELFAIMVGGLASVAGSIMAGYAGLGIDLKYLIAASFMAAPGGLLMAKIIYPETEPEKIIQEEVDFDEGDDKPANVIDAAASGAASGLKLAVNVGAMLLAFIALIALLNTIVGGISGLFGYDNITIELILGYVFAPFAFIIGVPVNEMLQAGSFIGQKVVVNEFFAYVNFVEIKDTLSPVTQAIVTFALCGFANLSSIAILLGGIGSMAPSRRRDIARLGVHAMLAATLANLMSAAIAGVFISL
ncbi:MULTISPECIES: NupC/NupG family nucleoside CNT transporter [unclassified Colwellia]|uniref:NupC/NupG family nucleoside CNT transporter n=1 Tax=unclassified Colwellia TaxID=196834 RepID=UPI0015F61487|nr:MULTISPECIES: NupC/NupG family nucleoside CNT transporter [unclassified Colwellia]MBA6232916.1 NupC/NupG family nucleoside CNT transporter [Colwellia sp. MB02u-7]MBA6237050.1 NupC/NupG family nucleoside CNT transporter [Colwellia sp. MB02u-11]MBA6258164.1 NupC/NupG family nucleoside CNT transporter [Colwellia sp. MB3u-28]MBA6259591.1 NupC/NupG family nucleoside CNT transporter [Colwellia sp. MB3u-41]MBA6299471.1 NupC/NupG family nucleoside CNT transporter [Colwellia sp. MB3u-22]